MKLSLISVVVVLMCGCASKVNHKLTEGGIESKELYKRTSTVDGSKSIVYQDIKRARRAINKESKYEPYTRSALNETEQLFDLLPNPKISIHVYPHLSTRDNAPVPGYTTAVSLYKADEYALPREVLAQGVFIEEEETPVQENRVKPDPVNEQFALDIEAIRALNRDAGGGDL